MSVTYYAIFFFFFVILFRIKSFDDLKSNIDWTYDEI